MLVLEQYIRLCNGSQGLVIGQPHVITLAEVAHILFCTPRNATLTLNKMQKYGWLSWQPGRGRGNRSNLICVIRPDDLVLSIAKEWVQKGEIRPAEAVIAEYKADMPGLWEAYARWMSSHFGIHRAEETGTVDILRLSVDRPFANLDPIQVLLRSQTHLVTQLFDPLVRFDEMTKTVRPHLVYDWERDESGSLWTFTLRKGVLFHHGRKLVADDVCYSIQRLMRGPAPHQWLVSSVEAVEAIGDFVVQFRLKKPNELFLQLLSKEYLSIVPRDYVEQMGASFAQMPVGTGAFRLLRNDDSMLVLEAFEPYFAGRPFLDRVEIWCVPQLEGAGMEDGTPWLKSANEERKQGEESGSAWQEIARLESCFQYASFNAAKEGPLRSNAFRQYLADLIDPVQMRADLGGTREGMGEWLDMPFVPSVEEHAGVTLSLYTYPDEDHVEDAEWIRDRCAQAGIRIEIVYATPEDLARPEVMQKADLVVDSANVDEREEVSLLEFLQAGALSMSHHLAPGTKERIAREVAVMLHAKTDRQRKRIAAKIMRELLEECTFVPLYQNRVNMLAHPRLAHVHLDAHGWIDFSRLIFRMET